MRIYELYGALYGTITPLGKGWYQLSTPLPRTRLEGCACSSPVARFYIYHTDSAVRELHPFTTITHLALQDAITDPTENSITIEFLFRRHGGATPFVSVTSTREGLSGKWLRWAHRYRKPSSTDRDIHSRIGSMADRAEWRVRQQDSFALFDLEPPFDPRESEALSAPASREGSADVEALAPTRRKNKAELLMDNASVPISLRLEGPFFTPANPSHYHTVVCLVEGAGISGALAIVSAFQQLERFERGMLVPPGSNYDMSAVSAGISEEGIGRKKVARKWKRCLIVWVVREEDFIQLPGLTVPEGSMMEVRIHFIGQGRKQCCYYQTLDGVLNKDVSEVAEGRTVNVDERVSLWCYAAGGKTFVGKVEEACKARQGRGVEWTVAEIAV